MRCKAKRWSWLALGALLVSVGCGETLPDPQAGRTIRGTVRYEGNAHHGFARPGVLIAALALVPPPAAPHATTLVETAALGSPVPSSRASWTSRIPSPTI
jgi:hypothetical protein